MIRTSLVMVCLLLLCACGRQETQYDDAERPAHHLPDGTFTNPHINPEGKNVFTYLRMRWFGDDPFAKHAGQEHRVAALPVDRQQLNQRAPQQPDITWIGHSTLLVRYGDVSILTDPIFSKRASPVSFAGPKRLFPPALNYDELADVDYVVISHTHYDHFDNASIDAIGDDAIWLVPLKVGELLEARGVSAQRIIELDWWQSYRDASVYVQATPSQHWSQRSLWDRNETLWASWAIDISGFKLWFGGDTGYNPYQFKEIGERWGSFDLAMIPIGAYKPRWFMQAQHVDPEQAVIIHQEINSRYSVGIHWGTFQLSAEEIDDPRLDLEAALTKHGVDASAFDTLAIGETRVLDSAPLQWAQAD